MTIIDPAGTPVVKYKSSEVTVQSVVAAATPTPLAAYSTYNVVLVDSGGDVTKGVALPSDADIGDVFELWAPNISAAVSPDLGFTVAFPGQTFFGQVFSGDVYPASVVRMVLRKASATNWLPIVN